MLVGCKNDVKMIRATIDGVQLPTSNVTSLRNLLFNAHPLFPVEPACALGHSSSRFELKNWIWKLPAVAVFNPTALVAGKPCSVRVPCNEVREWIGHRRF